MVANIALLAEVFVVFGLVGLIMLVYRTANLLEKIFIFLGVIGVALLMFVK